jgi:lysophospholipase L1-like esterase
LGVKLHSYYTPAKEHPIYKTVQHHDDTIRIAYIGDSWAFGHQFHQCKIKELLEKKLHHPVIVNSYGIEGLTSKEIYHALFELDSLKHFMEKGYDYCFISAGINDTYKKMSTTYYQESMECIIRFMLANHIHPILQEIPDYNIAKAYDNQKTEKKLLRKISMLINGTYMDCKQQFRNALDKLVQKKRYQDKVNIVRYKSWNKRYENDLNNLYIEDQMHLNEKGYSVLDIVIAYEIIKHYSNPY